MSSGSAKATDRWNRVNRKGKNMGYRTIRVRLINRPEAEHLDAVKGEMQTLGSPTIRVADAGDFFVALEGSHRLHAAAELDVPVIFDVIDPEDDIDLRTLDVDTMDEFDGNIVSCDDLVAYLCSLREREMVEVNVA